MAYGSFLSRRKVITLEAGNMKIENLKWYKNKSTHSVVIIISLNDIVLAVVTCDMLRLIMGRSWCVFKGLDHFECKFL